jgi:hypothetical protein
MYFMTSPATVMTLALEMMDEAARDSQRHRRGRPVTARQSARRTRAEAAGRPARRSWRLARAFRPAH